MPRKYKKQKGNGVIDFLKKYKPISKALSFGSKIPSQFSGPLNVASQIASALGFGNTKRKTRGRKKKITFSVI